jgi:hypothetical protein
MEKTVRKSVIARVIALPLAFAVLFGAGVVGSYAANASIAPDDRFFVYGMPTTEFTVQKFGEGVDPIWNVALAGAIKEWNDAHAAVKITAVDESPNKIVFEDLPRRALYSKICLPGHCFFKISIREDQKAKDGDWIRGEGKFLLVHELGHALGINDFDSPPTKQISVMSAKNNYGVPRVSIYDASLLAQRISWEKDKTQLEIIAVSSGEFFTPVSRAFNGYKN